MTYLNRGQAYAIDVADKHSRNEIITSTLILTFHDASHRKLANNYWTFWMTQQKNANRARALMLSNFDRITFDWNGSQGAKIYIQFHCLSTDFSRIKGVKGIPLRGLVYIERCFCKIKLFRDKGAERKNKDDAKQINKQFEKLNNGNQRYHPKWIVYRKPQPYSVFSELPQWASSDLETVPLQLPSASSAVPLTNYPPRAHQRVMTAPTMSHGLPSSSDMSLLSTIPSVPPYTELGSTLTMTALPNFMAAKSTIGPTETQWMTTDRTPVLDANPQWPISPPLATGMKRSRTQYEENSAMTTKDPSPSTTGPLPTTHSIGTFQRFT
ncbi:CP2 transcription factor-domain-containing protein [Radiomyces spectabilis]|uniref:CP2 transcription factor-domain-containing protein n=1 Tax=Radiomyces spectabilis TaxID=64574 RepID=UPI00221E72EA|nr:CP2 transcription factor-domain-containing protein [Radiomyces spectabilis]KAI8366735.1 CP2 transcription factor-domain-containing protein [Radiomyces spectabilis]